MGAVGEQPVKTGHGGHARAQAPGGANPFALRSGVQAIAHQHETRGAHAARAHGMQQDLGARVMPGDQRPAPEHLVREAAKHLREPVERVGMTWMILRVAV